VRETVAADVVSTAQPSNLVAACDGQIVSVTAYGGKSEVRAGQTVRKGDVLVSGVIDSEALGYRLVRARGEVIANVTKRFLASAPLETVEKVTTGNVKTEKTIKIFSKKAELFKKTNISFEKYDTIEKT
jgi:similar to stage IV sporulation protein